MFLVLCVCLFTRWGYHVPHQGPWLCVLFTGPFAPPYTRPWPPPWTCVTAAGLQAGNTRFTFVLVGVRSNWCTRRVVTATRSSIMVMNTISTLMGRHALASPKGGRPCSLSTLNYGVASHLVFQLT